jgi:hypothetical protein
VDPLRTPASSDGSRGFPEEPLGVLEAQWAQAKRCPGAEHRLEASAFGRREEGLDHGDEPEPPGLDQPTKEVEPGWRHACDVVEDEDVVTWIVRRAGDEPAQRPSLAGRALHGADRLGKEGGKKIGAQLCAGA